MNANPLREKAIRSGRIDGPDGPTWELPSWRTVLELLNEIDSLREETTRLRAALENVYKVGRGPHVAIARGALTTMPPSPGDPNVCANCGHAKPLHFDPNAYVPGKCNYGYDLCGCRDFKPGGILS